MVVRAGLAGGWAGGWPGGRGRLQFQAEFSLGHPGRRCGGLWFNPDLIPAPPGQKCHLSAVVIRYIPLSLCARWHQYQPHGHRHLASPAAYYQVPDAFLLAFVATRRHLCR